MIFVFSSKGRTMGGRKKKKNRKLGNYSVEIISLEKKWKESAKNKLYLIRGSNP